MRIYLLRHGEAEEGPGIPDEERKLTAAGRRKIQEVLRRARAAGASPSLILTSPLRRAIETGQLAASEFGVGALQQTRALEPDAPVGGVWDEIRAHQHEPEVLLAAHEPLLSGVVAHLIGGPTGRIDMRKATLARVDVERFGPQPDGVLQWLLTPELA